MKLDPIAACIEGQVSGRVKHTARKKTWNQISNPFWPWPGKSSWTSWRRRPGRTSSPCRWSSWRRWSSWPRSRSSSWTQPGRWCASWRPGRWCASSPQQPGRSWTPWPPTAEPWRSSGTQPPRSSCRSASPPGRWCARRTAQQTWQRASTRARRRAPRGRTPARFRLPRARREPRRTSSRPCGDPTYTKRARARTIVSHLVFFPPSHPARITPRPSHRTFPPTITIVDNVRAIPRGGKILTARRKIPSSPRARVGFARASGSRARRSHVPPQP